MGTAFSRSEPRTWYNLSRWQTMRRAQLQREPTCRKCREKGLVVAAQVADHITPHNGDWNAFWTSPLQSLCANCHSGPKQFQERRGYARGCDERGYPTDPNHPARAWDRKRRRR